MNKNLPRVLILAWLIVAIATSSYAVPPSTNCLKVKIYSKSKLISIKDKQKFVLHFQMENCGNADLPFDFYANLGYPKDTTCNIYFDISKADANSQYAQYEYTPVDYQNTIDSIMILHPRKIYSFYLPVFALYDIKDPGNYRIQGFYRFRTDEGKYFVQKSDYLYLAVSR